MGRVIAVGGDTVEITEDEKVKINGSKIVENDIFYDTPQYESDTVYPLTLNSGEYFILGDQRGNAKDSRYFGAVKDKEIKRQSNYGAPPVRYLKPGNQSKK